MVRRGNLAENVTAWVSIFQHVEGLIHYLTVRAEEVRVIQENKVKKSGHSTQPKSLHKKECEYYLLDRLPQYLMHSTAVQKYVALDLEVSETCSLFGSRLPRGRWKAWIEKRKNLRSVLDLARAGRVNQRPDTELPIRFKQRSKDQDQRQMKTASAGEAVQAPNNESEWAVKALLHLLQHPNLRHRIKTLLVDTLLEGLPKPLITHGRSQSHRRTFGREINSSHTHSSLFHMAEIFPIGESVEALAFFCRNRQA